LEIILENFVVSKSIWIGASIVAVVLIFSVIASLDQENLNLDMARQYGTVNTSLASPLLGDPSAPITIIEFGDYQCPNCKKWFLDTKPEINSNFINTQKVNLIYVDIAFLGKDSVPAARATYCADEQEKYWEYHKILYSNADGIDTGWANSERLIAFAIELDLDIELFTSCFDSGKYEKRVQFNTNESIKNGIVGTPTFIIVGPENVQKTINGPQPYSVFKNVIESMM
jgi:protein-disulfide isomerase